MSIDEKDVVNRAINGEGEAFAQLYDEYFDKIYRYIYIRLGNQAEAEDLTQEVFIKALGAIGSYKWRDLPFAAWLFRIARNHMIDHLRRVSKVEKVVWDDNIAQVEELDPVSVTEQKLRIEDIVNKIKKLSPAQRAVISLRFGSELSVAEVAEVLSKRIGTVKALQHSGIVALRKMLLTDR